MTIAYGVRLGMWVLIALGLVLAIVAPLTLLRPLRRTIARTETLSHAQLLIDLEQLKERNEELARVPARIDALNERVKRAQRSLEVSVRMLKLPQAMAALRGAGVAINALLRVFHA